MASSAPGDDAAGYSFRVPLHDPQKAVVDIVFVHGIGGHPVETWKSENKVYWPKDLLPNTIEGSRVLSWGHDANIGQFFGVKGVNRTINDISTSLLMDLFAYRRDTDTSERPIVFVAHSLGGIIALNALVIAQTKEDMTIVGEHVHALALLGTPLRGSKWVTVARALQLNLTITGSDLEKGSRNLDGLLQRALDILRKRVNKEVGGIYGACFFEEEGMTKLKGTKVVEKLDSTTDIFESIPLPGNHRSMCRFETITDKGYQLISDQLKTWVEKIGVSNPEQRGVHIGNSTFGPNYGGLNFGSMNNQGHTPVVTNSRFGYYQGHSPPKD